MIKCKKLRKQMKEKCWLKLLMKINKLLRINWIIKNLILNRRRWKNFWNGHKILIFNRMLKIGIIFPPLKAAKILSLNLSIKVSTSSSDPYSYICYILSSITIIILFIYQYKNNKFMIIRTLSLNQNSTKLFQKQWEEKSDSSYLN